MTTVREEGGRKGGRGGRMGGELYKYMEKLYIIAVVIHGWD